MKKSLKGIIVISFTILFNFFFWQEKFGINLVLITLIFGSILFYLNPDTRDKRQTLIAIIGIALSSFGILYHNSSFSKFMMFSSVFLFVASLLEKQIKTIYYLIPSGFLGIITSPFRKHSFFSIPKSGYSGKTWKYIKLSLIPLAVTLVFVILYSMANPVFASKINYLVENLGDYFAHLFEHYPISRFVFIALGLLIGIGIFYYQSLHLFDEKESKHTTNLTRSKHSLVTTNGLPKRKFSMTGLKTEASIALLTLISLNALLFFVNLLDINVFFVQNNAVNSDYSSLLHKGTWILIFSIILSAGIVLYIFRANLNFYKKNKWLKVASYVWIAQNMVLASSVIMRVYNYIVHHGLAYKRIGVIVFVIATIVGLITLAHKVKDIKSVSYLFRINGISIFSILLLTSLFNWDLIIAKHNINHAHNKDIDFLFELSLSDKTLPVLDQNRDILKTKNNVYKNYSLDSFSWARNRSLLERLDDRIEKFKKNHKKHTWLSWNYSDQKTAEYFNLEE